MQKNNPQQQEATDVIIVGAGLSGLIAANELRHHGLSVQILEANHRTGGRILDFQSQHGYTFPLGATWFGPDEEKLPALMAQLGLEAESQYETGDIVTRIHGQKRIVKNNEDVRVGPIPLPSDILPDDFLAAIHTLDTLCLEISLDDPYSHPKAAEWDKLSVADWWRAQSKSELGKTLLHMIIEGAVWTELDQISFLFLLYHWHALEAHIVDDRRIRGGPQQIINWLTEQLGDRIHLQAPVTSIEQNESGITIQTAKGTFVGQYTIVAIPPHLCTEIDFQPQLPEDRRQLARQIQMGKVMKIIVTYKEPFWRTIGLSGMMLTDEEPLDSTFDASPQDSTHGALISFISGRRARVWHERSVQERKEAILQQLTQLFGPQAATPLEYIEQDWLAEPWSGGCYCGVMPPGSMAYYGETLRRPVGRIYWAGTEAATMWYGSMEGAIVSGERAAQEVIEQI